MARKDGNSRRIERTVLEQKVSLAWSDAEGHNKFIFAQCLDTSQHGISLRVAEPIAVGSYVAVRSETLSVAGRAAVKYCIRRNGWYRIGIEFSAETR